MPQKWKQKHFIKLGLEEDYNNSKMLNIAYKLNCTYTL